MTRCTSDQCRQGHSPCPAPQACQLPDPAEPTQPGDRADTVEVVGRYVLFVAALMALVGALSLAAGMSLI